MAANLLQFGVPTTLVQNTVYALPANRCLLFCDASSPTITMSNVVGMSPAIALTLTNGQAEVAGAFIVCTTGSVVVSIKKY